MRITHPFHPLNGKQFVCVGERYNCHGKRLLLQVDELRICSVPPQWTDLAVPDPEIVIGKRRALFRVADLLDLMQLVEQLCKDECANGAARECQVNCAAIVKEIAPQYLRR